MTQPLKVLFVEDSSDDVTLLVRELRKGGFEPTWQAVDTPEAFRAALARGPWDVVLSDYAMPRFTGLAALRIIQDLGLDVPFILISGTVGEEVAVEAMRAGADDYLLKGSLTRLAPAVQRELRETQERRRRRQAERALAESRELVSLIYDHVSETLLLLAIDGEYGHRIVSLNRAAVAQARALGHAEVTAADLRGRVFEEMLRDVFHVPEAVVADVRRRIDAVAEHGAPVSFESSYQRHGVDMHHEITLIPVAPGESGPRHVLVANRDVTERRREEQARQRLEAQLVEAQKLEALGRLASGIAHDFNNVLASIVSHAALLRMGLGDDAARRAHVDDILEGAHRATELIKQILTYSRRQPVARKPVDLAAVVDEAVRLVRASVPAQVRLDVELASGAPPVLADTGQLHQVVMNLLTNAVQAVRGPGRVRLSTRTAQLDGDTGAVAIPPLAPGRYVELVVEDTGQGIDAATLPRIFEPFFTTRAAGGGTGLGLAVVQAIVQSHGGAIAVDSQPGRGTRFQVWLRAHDGEADGDAEHQGPPRGRGEHVLVVDDEAGLARVAAALLEQLGYRASWTTDAREGLGKLADVHVVLCDLSMPGMTGDAFAEKARAIAPRARIVLTTGYGGAIDAEAAKALGFDAMLAKPFTPDELATTIARVLGRA